MEIQLTKTQIGILEVLSIRWYEFVKVSDISNSSGLSISSIYESITELKERNIVIESNGMYKINFSNDIAWALKRLNDANKLYRLPERIRNKIIEIREKANLFFGIRILTILVFGSCASMEVRKNSDVDFLIVLSEKTRGSFLNFLTSEDRNFNFIEYEKMEFEKMYDEGDDFIISISKNNILLQGDSYIRRFLERDVPIVSKDLIRKKEGQINELKKKIDKFLHDDQPIAYEKIKEFIRLKVRLLLIKSNIVPISNKNLFDIMKKQFRKYYNAYNNLNMENLGDTYLELLREDRRKWEG